MTQDTLVRSTRRAFLTAAITTGMLGATNTVHAQEDGPFVLRATPDGWEARQPVRYQGTVNPSLLLWETHDIIWENTDGEPHGLVIESEAGEVLAQTEVVSTQGSLLSVRVSADLSSESSPARYYCPEHPDTMAGTFQQAEYGAYVDGTASATFTDGTSDGSTVTVDSITFDHTAGFLAIYEGEPFEGLETEEITRTYSEQSDELFLGVSDSLPVGEHTDVEVPLESPLEQGAERTLAAVPYVSHRRELEQSSPYQEPYGYVHLDLATITVEESPDDQDTTESPQAEFTYDPEEPRIGDEVTFTAAATDAIETYEWTISDNEAADLVGKTITYTFDETGEHEVTLRIVDEQANEDTTQETVSVAEVNENDTTDDTVPNWVPFAGATGIGFGAVGYLYGRYSQ